jgi:hypothetical protein
MVNNLNPGNQNKFLSAYLAVKPNKSLTQRMIAFDFKNRLFDFVWSIYQLHHFGYGAAMQLSRKSLAEYDSNYKIRRKALGKILAVGY